MSSKAIPSTTWAQAAGLITAFALLAMATSNPAAQEPAKAAAKTTPVRNSVISKAQVWKPTAIAALDIKAGPQGKGAFPYRATVRCEYLEADFKGHSPKFECATGPALDDHFKVKFGEANGEVYGEVLATRLLWALGFGADRMYPVSINCVGCPSELGGTERPGGERHFEPAVIERRMQGWEWKDRGASGWSWSDLKYLDPAAGGATNAQRDALLLLGVFLQHTDSKSEQQRILCLGTPPRSSTIRCNQPFLMISDLGLTFGKANFKNSNAPGSANLAGWKETPIWKESKGKQAMPGCIGNISRSLTGSLSDPAISEDGRKFLSGLLAQLSDKQIRDLFEVSRVTLRLRNPEDPASGLGTLDEWVETFKAKRQDIATRRCA